MQIKEFAARYQVSTDTVRFYEKEGLLNPTRLENGYRDYNAANGKTMEFIIVLKQLGFSLQEIKLLLSLENRPISPGCNNETSHLFLTKIRELEQQTEFLSMAIRTLQLTHTLMAQGKYAENKQKISELVDRMYEKIASGSQPNVRP